MTPYRCLPNRFKGFVLLANKIAVLFLWLAVHYSVTFHSMMCWGCECWTGWFWSGLIGSDCYGLVLCVFKSVCVSVYESKFIWADMSERTHSCHWFKRSIVGWMWFSQSLPAAAAWKHREPQSPATLMFTETGKKRAKKIGGGKPDKSLT